VTPEPKKKGQSLAFGVTWLAYATYYLGRKGFSVTKARIVKEVGLGETMLATIDTGYLAAYALGQFVNGVIGDRIGARRLVAGGMLLAAITCAAFGFASSAAIFLVAFTLNGFAQSTGWPGTTKAMTEWTKPETRGAVMGAWCTCYQVGGLVATAFATWLLSRYGWRSAFTAPAICIAAVGGLVFVALRPGPYIASSEVVDTSAAVKATSTGSATLAILRSGTLWSYGCAYFFIKLMRYSFLFWLPYYLHSALAVDDVTAGYLSTSFEIGGVVGAISIGLISDRLVGTSRSLVAAVSLVGLAGALLLYARLAPSSAVLQFSLMSLVGALLFGPDSLVSGAASQDAGGPEAAARATGFVNGVGSVGALLQGYVTVGLRKAFGWSAVFYVFVALALLSAAALSPTFRRSRNAAAASAA
jgi:sugar phosphate permease